MHTGQQQQQKKKEKKMLLGSRLLLVPFYDLAEIATDDPFDPSEICKRVLKLINIYEKN